MKFREFGMTFREYEVEIKGLVRKGIIVASLGMLSMMIAIYLYTYFEHLFILNMLVVLLEPTGWFMAWYGFDSVFYAAEEEKPERDFFRKMSKCQITFLPY